MLATAQSPPNLAPIAKEAVSSVGTSPANDIEVSVVMPCLNEARTVAQCVLKARFTLINLGINGEVIVADNGSSDGSPEIARDSGARVVHVKRKGYGSALQGGIAAARGKYIIMGDADESYDFSALGPFIERLRQGDDLVMGNRFRGGIRPGAMPWLHRYVGNPVLTGILNLFFHTPIGDAHCGLRAFRKDAYERLGLSTPGMEFASEMVVKAALFGQKISEVPTTLSPDGRDRPPHLRSFRDGWRHLRFLLLMCPFWLYLVPAMALIGLGGFGLVLRGFEDALVFPIASVVLGFQASWLWLCAKMHGSAAGLFPARGCGAALLRQLTLERGLIAAGIFASVGAVAGFLSLPGSEIWGVLILALGIQTALGSFFIATCRMTSVSGPARSNG